VPEGLAFAEFAMIGLQFDEHQPPSGFQYETIRKACVGGRVELDTVPALLLTLLSEPRFVRGFR
jgi:hypothetical protein